MPKFFWGAPSPDPTPVGAFGASIRVPSAFNWSTPDHISGYGPGSGIGKSMYFSILFDYTCTFLQLSIE